MIRVALVILGLIAIALVSLNIEAVLRAFSNTLMAITLLTIGLGMVLLGIVKAFNAIRLHILAFRSRKG